MTDNPFAHRVPRHDELYNPVLTALRALEGSASVRELNEQVIKDLDIPPHIAEHPHGQGAMKEVEYRLTWTRTYLKKTGLIDNSTRGVWSLTALGRETESVDPKEITQSVKEQGPPKKPPKPGEDDPPPPEIESEDSWREPLLSTLRDMSPDAFERLCQRLLRESGFTEVVVTGKSGDGGIDGHGIIRLAGLISFPVMFQCKRYSGSVPVGVVRDFRGAMIGRADKGLILTTGGFTRDAYSEATREGAPPIDLIDGELLMDKLKELSLGVSAKMVEVVEVDTAWFNSV
jgi:restriction system protein